MVDPTPDTVGRDSRGGASPPGVAVFLSLRLAPVAYIGSEATTALAMHANQRPHELSGGKQQRVGRHL